MKIGEHLRPREREKFFPPPLDFFAYQAGKLEPPAREIDRGCAACVQHGPLFGARLAWRNPHGAPRVRADDYDRRQIGGRQRFHGLHHVPEIDTPIEPGYVNVPFGLNLLREEGVPSSVHRDDARIF